MHISHEYISKLANYPVYDDNVTSSVTVLLDGAMSVK